MKTFVLDTNVLLIDPRAIYKFQENDLVIPMCVVRELDKFKKDMSEIGRNAREMSRVLDKLRSKGDLRDGISLGENLGTIKVVFKDPAVHQIPPGLTDSADDTIIAIAKHMDSAADTDTVIISQDTYVRIKANAYGIKANEYLGIKVKESDQYGGVAHLSVSQEQMNELFVGRTIPTEENLLENQYVSLSADGNSEGVPCIHKGSELCLIQNNKDAWGLNLRSQEQIFAMHALMDPSIELVTLSGASGCGKTLMAIAAGLQQVTDEEVYDKMLVSRPIFALGKDLGYLPGDVGEKMSPWMQPIHDNLEFLSGDKKKGSRRKTDDLFEQGMLVVEPITYIRGRSLPDRYFLIDEAQNTTPHEIKTILTRAGENTKIVLTGDPAQIDSPYLDSENNGLTYVIEKFKNESIAAHITLKQGERSNLATISSELL